MPIYEYGCYDCRKRVSVFWRTFSAAETGEAKCPRCGGNHLKRLVSQVGMVRSEESRLESLADPANFGDLDENDPKSLARMMRQMGDEVGENMGPEFDEVLNRLESGQNPDEIEQDMPDLASDMGGSGAADDWFD